MSDPVLMTLIIVVGIVAVVGLALLNDRKNR